MVERVILKNIVKSVGKVFKPSYILGELNEDYIDTPRLFRYFIIMGMKI